MNARDWIVAVALLVAVPVTAGATYHHLYGLVPGLVMFIGAAGTGVALLLARTLHGREVRR